MTKKEMIIDILKTPSDEEEFKGTEWIAYVIQEIAHGGQYRENGEPYSEHPKRCREAFYNLVAARGWCKRCVLEKHGIPHYGIPELAYLHDVVEDTELTHDDVKDIFTELGYEDFFNNYIHVPLKLITHDKRDTYDSYLDRVMEHPTSAFVKMLDLSDNMNLFGLSHLGEDELNRTIRYARYFKRINDKYHYLEKLEESFPNGEKA